MTSAQPRGAAAARAAPKRELRADFLLNFNRPAASQRPQYAPPPRRPRAAGGGAPRSTPASFGKGRFVQSSFRILVDTVTPDVGEATVNADALLDWSSVSRVDLQCEEPLKCPICLEEEMVVPKISRCGHVFCVSCVFRYFLALQEYNGKFNQKCPVCNNQHLSPEELVSVRFVPVKAPREGDRVRLVLARRAVSSTVVRPPPLPAAAGGDAARRRPGGADEAPWALPVEGEDGWELSRLARLQPGDYDRNLGEELETLRSYRAACLASGDTELLPSIDAAGSSLAQLRRDRAAAGCGGGDLDELCLPAAAAAADAAEVAAGGGSVGSVPPSPGLGARASPSLGPEASPAAASNTGSAAPRGNPGHLISFFQVDDGRLVFLQPFFTRFLLHEHGGEWSGLPHCLPDVRIERVQQVSVSDETRRRHRFLSHLPLGTQISFVEVDLRGHLSRATKEHFADDFQKIREQRKRDQAKSKREDRLSKSRAQMEEEKLYAAANRPHPSTYTPQIMPTKEDFVPLPGRAGGEGPADVEAAAEEEQEEDADAGPTLAEKLKQRLAARARPGDPRRFPRLGGGGGEGAANLRPDDPERFPRLGGGGGGGSVSASVPAAAAASAPAAAAAAATAPASGSAWGTKLPAKKTGPLWEVKDEWDADSGGEGESKNFGAALEAALQRSSQAAATAAAPPQDAADAEAVEAEAEPAGGAAAGKKKKGRAGKATTIRLFG